MRNQQDRQAQLKQQLRDLQLYLRSDFIRHLSREDTCATHCSTHALSNSNSGADYASSCRHAHSMSCQRCNERFCIMADIDRLIKEAAIYTKANLGVNELLDEAGQVILAMQEELEDLEARLGKYVGRKVRLPSIFTPAMMQ